MALLGVACGSDPVAKHLTDGGAPPPDASADGAQDGSLGGAPGAMPLALEVPVSATTTTYVKLSPPAVVQESDPAHATDWDLAFVGYDVFTNGGISGPGNGAAFGPLSVGLFGFPDEPVSVPFLIPDEAASAFVAWYAYESSTHDLYTRFHVYGVSSGGHHYKLQILDYYGGDASMPVSGLYQLRYAEVTAHGSGKTVELDSVDGTLDGTMPSPNAPSACLTLATGDIAMLSPVDAVNSSDWDICFWRDAIDVNGGIGGPGGVTAVDLEAADLDTETLTQVKQRTADNQAALFDGIDYAALTSSDLDYRGDYAVSAFTGQWADLGQDPPVPTPAAAFLVVAADGTSRYLVSFNAFDGADATSPGTVELGIAPSVSP